MSINLNAFFKANAKIGFLP